MLSVVWHLSNYILFKLTPRLFLIQSNHHVWWPGRRYQVPGQLGDLGCWTLGFPHPPHPLGPFPLSFIGWSSQRSKRSLMMETICYNRSRQFGGKQTGLKELIVHRGNTPHQLCRKLSTREGYFTFINNDESNEENNTVISHIKARIRWRYLPPTS